MLNRLILMGALLLSFALHAETFTAGKDYEILANAESPNPTEPVKVVEFFSYGCPWCYRIEPSLAKWVKQQGQAISFSRLPVIFHKDWVYYAKAYYMVHLLKEDEQLNPILFDTIQNKKIALGSSEAMINFFTQHGVDKATAESAFNNSTTIEMQLTQGATLMSRYHVNAIPALIIDGRFKTDMQMAQNEERLFKILTFLVTEARKKA